MLSIIFSLLVVEPAVPVTVSQDWNVVASLEEPVVKSAMNVLAVVPSTPVVSVMVYKCVSY